MKLEQVAVQTYTIRDFLKTPEEVAASMKRLREMGYLAVQLSGLGEMDWGEVAKIVADEGLVCCATHEPSEEILDTPETVVERLQTLNCTLTAYPYPAGIDVGSMAAIDELCAKLNHAGKVLADAGQVLAYHNHHLEFRRVEGKTALEWIYEKTDPAYLKAELDTYWVQMGGADPVAWCRKVSWRQPIIHLKDFQVNDENASTYCEIGNGNLDFKAIIAAAEEGGTEWFAVEQDTCPGNPFDSLQQSFDYIRGELVEA
jgi:sugar phosphate isomerase/epimerase